MHFAASVIPTALIALMLVAGAAVAPARGADCGAGVGPCRCGDRVVTSTKLGASDPILRGPCACDGLAVASDVTLDIAGTIKGNDDVSSFCAGVRIEIDAANVIVRTGRVEGFGFGILGEFGVNVRVSGIQASSNGSGIHVEGVHIVVDGNIARGNGEGILVAGWPEGTGVIVRGNRAEGNGIGIYVLADTGFLVSGNVATGNYAGFAVQNGTGVGDFILELNRSEGNRGLGFGIGGENIQVLRNIATRNSPDPSAFPSGDGFTSECVACRFAQNRSDYNGGFGIFDGYGNTYGNVYTGNRCTGNALGPSDPSGLCK